MLEYTLSKLLPSFVIQTINADEIHSIEWEKNCSLLVFPGGATGSYYARLNSRNGNRGNERIKNYVMNGGRYLGICAGAYYACSSINFQGDFHDHYELAFFHGEGKGPALKGYDAHSTIGSYAASFSFVIKDQIYHAKSYFKGGPFFLPKEDVCVLAKYENHEALECEEGSIGCVQCKVGKGTCVLCAFHVEYDPWLMKKGLGIDSVIEELREQSFK